MGAWSIVDRDCDFYRGLGWRLDADFVTGPDFCVVQVTRPVHDVGGLFHHAGTRARVSGPAEEHVSYGSWVWPRPAPGCELVSRRRLPGLPGLPSLPGLRGPADGLRFRQEGPGSLAHQGGCDIWMCHCGFSFKGTGPLPSGSAGGTAAAQSHLARHSAPWEIY